MNHTALEPMIPALRRYARAMLRDRDLADDLVQDCLERAVAKWALRRRDEDTRQWVFAIMHNLIAGQLRQQARRGLHLDIAEVDEARFAAPATQEQKVRHGELLRALATLPEEQRSVILLVSVEDLSYAETAQTLGIPMGTVMSRLSRGRERLQRALDGGMPAQAPLLRRMK